jgi:hypothetical protein
MKTREILMFMVFVSKINAQNTTIKQQSKTYWDISANAGFLNSTEGVISPNSKFKIFKKMKKIRFYLAFFMIFTLFYGCKPTICNEDINLGLAIILKDKITGDTLKAASQSIVFKTTNSTGNVQLAGRKWVTEKYFTVQFIGYKTKGTYPVEVLLDNVSKGSFDVVLGGSEENCNEAVNQIDSFNNKGNANVSFTKTFVGIINTEWLMVLKN